MEDGNQSEFSSTLKNILNSINSMIYITDPDSCEILFVNDCMKEHFGITGKVEGRICYELLQKDMGHKCDFCPCYRLDKEPDAVIEWKEYSTLTNRIYHNTDKYIDWPGKGKVHLQHSVDVTELVTAAEERKQTNERISLMLDATPLACTLRDKNFKVFDCNEEAVRLFRVKDKQEFREEYDELSPKYQPDGRLSVELNAQYMQKAYKEGKCVFEWLHQTIDGTLFPAERTLIRVDVESSGYTIVGYTRDLREQKRMMYRIEKRGRLLHTVNQVADILLQSDNNNIDADIQRCMGMIGEAVGADRVCIWKNHFRDKRLCCTELYEWLIGTKTVINTELTTDVAYDDRIPGWEETLSRGDCINSLVRDLTPKEQAQLLPQGILSVVATPVFIQDKFWGFVGFDNCHEERMFTEAELSIMRSGGLLIAHALVRHEMSQNIRKTAALLQTVVENYPGIIWCIDRNEIVTLINGVLLNKFNVTPDSLIGKLLNDVPASFMHPEAAGYIRKTFSEGAQEWVTENQGFWHMSTSPIYGDDGNVTHVVGNSDDITELVAAREAAEQSNRSKGIFIAQMSHEIRTPMNAILGIAEIQLREEQLPANAKEGFGRIYDSGNLLLNIINDILDFSKIDAGKMEIVPNIYDIPSLVNDTVQLCRLRYESKPITFILDVDQNMPLELIGDELRIRQILNNLLSNAYKYTDTGEIKLSVTAEPGFIDGTVILVLKVSDTGQGMNEDQVDRIFDEYVRFNMEANQSISGTGLGMPITKRLIDMMGGQISVESETGKGSVFIVRLPQRDYGSGSCGADIAERLRNFKFSDTSISKNAQLVHEYMPYGKVLIVDDVESNLYVAKGLLTPYGLDIETVKSGAEAIEKINNGSVYDIVFMDHMMPGMDGIKATRILRGSGYSHPIVALTANAMSGQSEIFLSNGFDRFISKPIDSRELDFVLKELIRDKKPPEIVEAARQEKENAVIQPKKGVTELEQYFVMDAEDTVTMLESIYAKIDDLDDTAVESYTIALHGIKSALRNIGETKLSEFAFELEKAGAARNFDFIINETPILVKELNSLVAKFKPKKTKSIGFTAEN